jgi:STE20-like kinase
MKASNILLTETGQVKLCDFGVSSKSRTYSEKRNSFIGTPYWMSPEVIDCQTNSERLYDYKADIWSLGITCIELAETEPPLNEYNETRVLLKILKSDPPSLKYPNYYSNSFNDFISWCLNRDPSRRPNAEDLLRVTCFF